MKLKHLSLSVMLIGAVSTVHASGYHFGTQSVSSQSTANASAAEASDASTIFYNAAGMTKLPGTNFSGALNLVAPSVKYSNAKGNYTTPGPNGTRVNAGPIAGVDSGKLTDDVLAVPHFYLTHQLNDKVTAGLGVYVPFASGTEYQRNSVLRYNVNETHLKTIDINPTIAFKLNEQHSVAVGVIAQYAEAKLRQYANFGAAVGQAKAQAYLSVVTGGKPANATPVQLQAAGKLAAAENGKYDGFAEVKGDDWGFGFNLAWMWDINDQTTVGVNYRSKVKHTLEGDGKWTRGTDALVGTPLAPVAGIIAAGYVDKETTKVGIETPESLSVHGMYKVDSRLTTYGDVTWTRHSRFDQLAIEWENPKLTQGNKTYLSPEWKNTYKVAVGASYQYSEPLQLRGGIAFDKTPTPDEEHRLSTMPDNDRIWFSFGGNYKLNKQSSVDVAYSYIKIKNGSAKVDGTPEFNGVPTHVSSNTQGSADFKAHAQILGVQYNYRF